MVLSEKGSDASASGHRLDSVLVNVCWKDDIDESMEFSGRRSISGLEWKAERTSIGSKGHFLRSLPPGSYQGNIEYRHTGLPTIKGQSRA